MSCQEKKNHSLVFVLLKCNQKQDFDSDILELVAYLLIYVYLINKNTKGFREVWNGPWSHVTWPGFYFRILSQMELREEAEEGDRTGTGLAVQVRDAEILSRALSVAEIEDEANFRK